MKPEKQETEAQRKKRLRAEVFGDVLPETTSDERGSSSDETSDEWLKQQVPPHHG